MLRRWAGPLIAVLIIGGVGLIVLMNLDTNSLTNPSPSLSSSKASATADADANPDAPTPGLAKPASFREYPIGDQVEKNQIQIAAVWLPAILMDGMTDPGSADMIHLEADIHATENNPNGFAQDEFVPYLKVKYEIFPKGSDKAIQGGEMIPMVAGDGLHYGASLVMPKAGEYRLVYQIEPPSAGGLGRHSDAATGVAPWWEPFEVSFDWEYEGPPTPAPAAGADAKS